MKEALYLNPLRDGFSDAMEDQQCNAGTARGGCFDKVGVQDTAAAGDLQAFIGEPDRGWCLRAIRASGNYGPLKAIKQQWRNCEDERGPRTSIVRRI